MDTYSCTCGALDHARRTNAPRVTHTGKCNVASQFRKGNKPAAREAEKRRRVK